MLQYADQKWTFLNGEALIQTLVVQKRWHPVPCVATF